MNISIIAGIRNKNKGIDRFGNYINKDYFTLYSNDVTEHVKINVKIDYIIHAASLASPQYYGSNPVETILPNVIGTYELFEFARKNKIESMLFFSSGAVYGDVENVDSIKEKDFGILDF